MSSKQTPRLMANAVYISPFVVDNKGDVWKIVQGGDKHRLYNYFTKNHPNKITEELKMKIYLEDIKRIQMSKNYNYFNSK